MINTIDLDKFEPYLMKGIVSDPLLLSKLVNSVNEPKEIFTDKGYITTLGFYWYYFDKTGRLPTLSEIDLLVKDDTINVKIKNTLSSLDSYNYLEIDTDIFYETSERFIKNRFSANAILELAKKHNEGEHVASLALEKFEHITSISLNDDQGLNFFKDIDKITAKFSEEQTVLSTGYKVINDNIDGGFYTTDPALYMFMAPPNKGKSIFLGNIAVNLIKQGKTVLVVSLEMSEYAYAKRFCSQISSIPFSDIKNNIEEVTERVKSNKLTYDGTLLIKEFPPSTITVSHLRSWIKTNLINKGIKLDAIVIDYINLFAGSGNGLYEKIKDIAEQTRALSYHFRCPICSATQQNRSANGKEMAGLNSVSESSGLSMTADVILELFQNEEDKILNIFRVGFAKNRYGPVEFAIAVKVNFATLTISELDEEIPYTSMIGTVEETLEQLMNEVA